MNESSKLLGVPSGAPPATPDGADDDHKTSARQSFLALLKGNVGPGCLSLPWAVSQLGLLWGTVAIIVMCLWTSYNCLAVVDAKVRIVEDGRQTGGDVAVPSYPDVGGWAYGPRFRELIRVCICVQQLAICTVFFSFVGENILAVLQFNADVTPAFLMSHGGVITAVLPIVVGLALVPNLRVMAPAIALATAFLFAGLGSLGYVVLVAEARDGGPEDVPAPEWGAAPLAMCAILYSFEGVCLILPVEKAMAEPQQFKKVFFWAMVFVAAIFSAVAGLCVHAFGEVTNGSVTAFLLEKFKEDASVIWWLMVANTLVSFSVLFTYPLQLFPTLDLLGPKVAAKFGLTDSKSAIPGDSIYLRVGLVLLTYVVAVIVPNVQILISLAGAVAGSSVALLIPPMIELALVDRAAAGFAPSSTPDVSPWRRLLQCDICGEDGMRKFRCFVLFWLGFVFMCIGAGASIYDILKLYIK